MTKKGETTSGMFYGYTVYNANDKSIGYKFMKDYKNILKDATIEVPKNPADPPTIFIVIYKDRNEVVVAQPRLAFEKKLKEKLCDGVLVENLEISWTSKGDGTIDVEKVVSCTNFGSFENCALADLEEFYLGPYYEKLAEVGVRRAFEKREENLTLLLFCRKLCRNSADEKEAVSELLLKIFRRPCQLSLLAAHPTRKTKRLKIDCPSLKRLCFPRLQAALCR